MLYTPASSSVPETEGIMYAIGGHPFWSLCTLNLLACQVRVTVGDSYFCCCVRMTFTER